MVPLQGARVYSLVRELRSCMLSSVAKKRKKRKEKRLLKKGGGLFISLKIINFNKIFFYETQILYIYIYIYIYKDT